MMKFIHKVFSWYLNKSSLPYWGILLLDLLVGLLSGLIAYAIIKGPEELGSNLQYIVGAMVCYLPIYALTGKLFHSYDIRLRFTSIVDLQRLSSCVFSAALVIFVVRQYVPLDRWLWPISGKTVLLGSLLALLFIMLIRLTIKGIMDHNAAENEGPKAVIYGVDEFSELLVHLIQEHGGSVRYRVVGFLSENSASIHSFVAGKRVFRLKEESVKLMLKNNVRALICTPLTVERLRENKDLVQELLDAGIKIKIMPQLTNYKEAQGDLQLREVEIEDLLPREQISVDMDAIGELLADRTIFITGAAGSIGAELVQQIAQYKPKMMVLVDQAETPLHSVMLNMKKRWPEQTFEALVSSITKTRQMEGFFRLYRPDYVFHAAAYKHVPMMEISPANAVQNNCMGTRVIADLAVKYGVKKFVMISTDKAVNPTNVMGCSKRICEIYCQSLNKNQGNTEFITTRFGNVLGSNGSVIPIFKEQIKSGGPVTVTHPEIVRYFMLIPEACKLVLQAGTMGHGGEIYAFDMGEPVRIADLAQRMIDLSGVKGVKIEYTGLRDGEKLYEEVMNEEENTLPTSHSKIRVAKVREYDYAEVLRNEKELEEISYTYDEMAIVKKMKEIVPEFKSQHSRFEVLDE